MFGDESYDFFLIKASTEEEAERGKCSASLFVLLLFEDVKNIWL